MDNNGISSKRASSTGQWKKLIFTKHHSDKFGAVWKISTWKVFIWMMVALGILVILYSFLVENQAAFFQDVIFYAIVTVIIVAVVWVGVGIFSKGKKIFIGFILAWILILGLYIFLAFIFSFIGITYHFGFSTWSVITFLALIGAKRIDGNLDKQDLGYGLLVLLILVIGNYPIFENGGFLAQLDSVISFISEKLSYIDTQQLV